MEVWSPVQDTEVKPPDTAHAGSVGSGETGGGGQGIVRLQLDHGPDRDSHGGQGILERLEVRE
jgi:hypothetical protein